MAQENQAFAHRGEICHIIPRASTKISSGDYVAMARNTDPISRAVLGGESRVSPSSTGYTCQWGVGISDTDFNGGAVGATLYAAPTSDQAIPVIRRGVVRLAITQTSGKTGDLVILNSGTSGSQTFNLNNMRRDIAVGQVYENFSGATTNDPQLVELFEKPMAGRDIYFHLGNGVVQGCVLKHHSIHSDQGSTQIIAGATGENNYVRIKNKMFTVARLTDYTVGSINPGGAGAIRFMWAGVKISTTGRAVTWTINTCTGPFSGFASLTNSGISMGMMVPLTWTSNIIPVGLVIGWSVSQYTIRSHQIMNLGAGGQVPWGVNVGDHETWYL